VFDYFRAMCIVKR